MNKLKKIKYEKVKLSRLQKIVNFTSRLGIIAGFGVLTLYGINKLGNNLPKENSTFKHENYREYFKDYEFLDMNGDKFPDFVHSVYDFNKNGYAETNAYYLVTGLKDGMIMSEKTARIVIIENEKTGDIKYALIDSDGDGILEKKLKELSKNIEKKQIKKERQIIAKL